MDKFTEEYEKTREEIKKVFDEKLKVKFIKENRMIQDYTYSDFNGITYVFMGENATTGTPNRLTHRMSYYGQFYQTKDKKLAKKFIEDYGHKHRLVDIGDSRRMRRYNLGASLMDFFRNIECCTQIEDVYYFEGGV